MHNVVFNIEIWGIFVFFFLCIHASFSLVNWGSIIALNFVPFMCLQRSLAAGGKSDLCLCGHTGQSVFDCKPTKRLLS